jgi:ATP-dependent RNA circularization protein (DNA/RNA ligase family)
MPAFSSSVTPVRSAVPVKGVTSGAVLVEATEVEVESTEAEVEVVAFVHPAKAQININEQKDVTTFLFPIISLSPFDWKTIPG